MRACVRARACVCARASVRACSHSGYDVWPMGRRMAVQSQLNHWWLWAEVPPNPVPNHRGRAGPTATVALRGTGSGEPWFPGCPPEQAGGHLGHSWGTRDGARPCVCARAHVRACTRACVLRRPPKPLEHLTPVQSLLHAVVVVVVGGWVGGGGWRLTVLSRQPVSVGCGLRGYRGSQPRRLASPEGLPHGR